MPLRPAFSHQGILLDVAICDIKMGRAPEASSRFYGAWRHPGRHDSEHTTRRGGLGLCRARVQSARFLAMRHDTKNGIYRVIQGANLAP